MSTRSKSDKQRSKRGVAKQNQSSSSVNLKKKYHFLPPDHIEAICHARDPSSADHLLKTRHRDIQSLCGQFQDHSRELVWQVYCANDFKKKPTKVHLESFKEHSNPTVSRQSIMKRKHVPTKSKSSTSQSSQFSVESEFMNAAEVRDLNRLFEVFPLFDKSIVTNAFKANSNSYSPTKDAIYQMNKHDNQMNSQPQDQIQSEVSDIEPVDSSLPQDQHSRDHVHVEANEKTTVYVAHGKLSFNDKRHKIETNSLISPTPSESVDFDHCNQLKEQTNSSRSPQKIKQSALKSKSTTSSSTRFSVESEFLNAAEAQDPIRLLQDFHLLDKSFMTNTFKANANSYSPTKDAIDQMIKHDNQMNLQQDQIQSEVSDIEPVDSSLPQPLVEQHSRDHDHVMTSEDEVESVVQSISNHKCQQINKNSNKSHSLTKRVKLKHFKQLKALQSSSNLIDFELVKSNHSFSMHRSVLNLFSDFFLNLESKVTSFELPDHLFPMLDLLDQVLMTFYGETITVTPNIFFEIITIAKFLKFSQLEKLCNDIIVQGFQGKTEIKFKLHRSDLEMSVSKCEFDISIVVNSFYFTSNKVILASVSEYFLNEFTHPLSNHHFETNFDFSAKFPSEIFDSDILTSLFQVFVCKDFDFKCADVLSVFYFSQYFKIDWLSQIIEELLNDPSQLSLTKDHLKAILRDVEILNFHHFVSQFPQLFNKLKSLSKVVKDTIKFSHQPIPLSFNTIQSLLNSVDKWWLLNSLVLGVLQDEDYCSLKELKQFLTEIEFLEAEGMMLFNILIGCPSFLFPVVFTKFLNFFKNSPPPIPCLKWLIEFSIDSNTSEFVNETGEMIMQIIGKHSAESLPVVKFCPNISEISSFFKNIKGEHVTWLLNCLFHSVQEDVDGWSPSFIKLLITEIKPKSVELESFYISLKQFEKFQFLTPTMQELNYMLMPLFLEFFCNECHTLRMENTQLKNTLYCK
ncbi:hypothetical protein GEMRC1_004435 [Eukaryota sp. GEM-RC1]